MPVIARLISKDSRISSTDHLGVIFNKKHSFDQYFWQADGISPLAGAIFVFKLDLHASHQLRCPVNTEDKNVQLRKTAVVETEAFPPHSSIKALRVAMRYRNTLPARNRHRLQQ